jgi:hypothetical protein
MPSYTVNYAKLSEADKIAAAIADCRTYMAEKFVLIEQTFEVAETHQQALFLIGLAGIRGYPVHALFQHYRPDLYAAWLGEDE